MKVVFDSNIYISALVFPGGQAERAIERVIRGPDTLFISKPIVDEVVNVLARKFSRSAEELAKTAVTLSDLGTVVRPSAQITILEDESDNRILECAADYEADVIVTGDKALLSLQAFGATKSVTLRSYLSSA